MSDPGAVSAGGSQVSVSDVEQIFITVAAGGLPGATAASRYVGATTSGAPISGTFAIGDFVADRSGAIWICIAAGTPGTWVAGGMSPPSGTPMAGDVPVVQADGNPATAWSNAALMDETGGIVT